MVWLLLILALYVVLLVVVARFSVYPFRTPLFISPGAMGTPQEDVELVGTDGLRLAAWWIGEPLGENASPTTVVVFAHGYMMNRAEPSPLAATMWRNGYSSLLFDFPAHGRSDGKKTGFGYPERKDVALALQWVRQRFPEARIVLWGSSMGSAASALAVAEHPGIVDALILDSAYSQLLRAIPGWWEFVGGRLLRILLAPTVLASRLFVDFSLSKVDVAEALAKVGETPVLLMHGRADVLATPEHAERNLAAAKNGRIIWYEGCGHSEARWLQPHKYHQDMLAFLDEALKSPS
jgi:uncharacterized protein